VVVKPHPYISLEDLKKYPWKNKFEFTNVPLESLWETAELIYGAGSTTAVLEGAWVGRPTILFRGSRFLNLCPLPEGLNYREVRSVEELRFELTRPSKIDISPKFFALDSEYPRWKKLLSVLEH